MKKLPSPGKNFLRGEFCAMLQKVPAVSQAQNTMGGKTMARFVGNANTPQNVPCLPILDLSSVMEAYSGARKYLWQACKYLQISPPRLLNPPALLLNLELILGGLLGRFQICSWRALGGPGASLGPCWVQ